MTSFIHLIKLDVLLLFKKKTIWRLILLPPLFILILGTIFGQQDLPVKPIAVAIYSADHPAELGAGSTLSFGKVLTQTWRTNSAIKSLVHVKRAASRAQARKWLARGRVSVVLDLPASFSKNIVENKQGKVNVSGKSGAGDNVTTVQMLVRQFITHITVQLSERAALAPRLLAQRFNPMAMKTVTQIVSEQDVNKAALVAQAPEKRANPISNMHYYAAAMVVLFSISTALVLVHQIVAERLGGVLSRMRATPLRAAIYIVGRLTSIVLAILLQMLVIIAVSRIAFGVHWGSMPAMLLVTFIYAFAIGSLVLVCGLLAKDQASVSGVGGPIMYVFGFLGGSMIKIDSFPASLQAVQSLLPNGCALNAYLSVGRGQSLGQVAIPLAELFALGIIFFGIAVFIYQDGGRKRYASLNDAAHTA